jgi:predicted RNA binding protein YcfA (HicA-like mRNA interferase family)
MVSGISRKHLIQKFKMLGFEGPFSGGKHQFVKKGSLKVRISNPHGSKDIHDSLLKEILRQAGIAKKDWDKA